MRASVFKRRKVWSDGDVSELRAALKSGRSIQETAIDLSLDADDVVAKIAELSEQEHKIRDAAKQSGASAEV
jgi:hypothetical protein